MTSWNRPLCLLALAAALLGALGTAPCRGAVLAATGDWTLAEPCRPADGAGEAEHSGCAGSCPCDPVSAIPAVLSPPPQCG